MNSNGLKKYQDSVINEVENNILPFWIFKVLSEKPGGGFYGLVDSDGFVDKEAPRGAVMNARILWTFAKACRFMRDNFADKKEQIEKYYKAAVEAYNYLEKYFTDKDFGGIYWLLNANGKPMDTKKQVYAQAFYIYALAEFYMVSKDEKVKKTAVALFELLEAKCFDNQANGYFEAYKRNWQILEDVRLSDKDMNEKKTMNTHLHVLEAYTNLYRIHKSDKLHKQLKNLIEVFISKFIDPETWHFKLFFTETWELRSETISFGHDIEGSWLLAEAAEVLGDKELIEKVNDIALKMANAVIEEGLDEDGAIFNEKDSEGYDYDKHWWPQAEAAVGFLNAYQVSGADKYFEASKNAWYFIEDHLVDNKIGEWFWRTDKNGKPYTDDEKAGMWKCPYHNSRACFEVAERVKKMIK